MIERATILDAHGVRIECWLPGAAERIWAALTEPAELPAWLAVSKNKFTAGGEIELWFDVDEAPERQKAGSVIRGVVTEFEPPRRLALSWNDPAVESRVIFELDAKGDGVQLSVTHRDLPIELVSKCGAGWHTHLSILRARLTHEEPDPFLAIFKRVLPHYEAAVDEAATTGTQTEVDLDI